jgi:hypothetical protein
LNYSGGLVKVRVDEFTAVVTLMQLYFSVTGKCDGQKHNNSSGMVVTSAVIPALRRLRREDRGLRSALGEKAQDLT